MKFDVFNVEIVHFSFVYIDIYIVNHVLFPELQQNASKSYRNGKKL